MNEMAEMHYLIRHELFELLKFNNKYKSFWKNKCSFYEAILSF